MPQTSAREVLLRFLDDRVFQPTLGTQPLAYGSVGDRKLLKSVQKRVHESRVRYFADYPTAGDVKSNFAQDLNSKPGQELAADMWILMEIFERAIMERPEVLECYLMTGDADYILRVVVRDVEAYERLLRDVLTRIESVAGIKSSFALKRVKHSTARPLGLQPCH